MHLTNVKIIADHINETHDRITTFELRYPRMIHAEFMTHRMFSRNASSNRAIPTKRILDEVRNSPFVPDEWGENKPGMQADVVVDEQTAMMASLEWVRAAENAINTAERLLKLGVHKQLANRVLEPYQFITTIVTATNYENFFALRCHKDAQPEIQALAWMMAHSYYSSEPKLARAGDWHLPYTSGTSTTRERIKCSVARCARVSYKNHNGTDPDVQKDLALHDRLLAAGHMSPFEHQAVSFPGRRSGNFQGWMQYRKSVPNEVRRFQYLSH